MIFSAIKKMWFWRNYTTNQHTKWWQKRNIDWKKEYLATWNHPHRLFICALLKTFSWRSLFEVGCGAGANILALVKNFQDIQLGGVDINPQAIEVLQKTFSGGIFKVNDGMDIMMSDGASDVMLTDMYLIYVGRFKILKQLKEIRRISRRTVILCEFHSTSLIKRLKLLLTTGYHAYNYKKLLEKLGFYDIMIIKIPKEYWPDDPKLASFRYIIKATKPQKGYD